MYSDFMPRMNQIVEKQRKASCSWTENTLTNLSQNKWQAFVHTEEGFWREGWAWPLGMATVTSRAQYDTDGTKF